MYLKNTIRREKKLSTMQMALYYTARLQLRVLTNNIVLQKFHRITLSAFPTIAIRNVVFFLHNIMFIEKRQFNILYYNSIIDTSVGTMRTSDGLTSQHRRGSPKFKKINF